MALIKCNNGHFYDKEKYNTCPFCNKNQVEDELQKTIFKDISLEDISQIQYTQAYSDNGSSMDKTIGVIGLNNLNQLVTGWLVITKGKARGKSYPLHFGKNIVGRSLHMDISLTEEETITRENHFSVVFENKECSFYIVEGNSPIMLNDKLVKEYMELKENDVIATADVELTFIPYCKKGREWHEEKDN